MRADGRRCPKCGAVIKYLYYWEKAVNIGEYWPDGLHNIRTDHVIECYFACPKCGEILFFDDVEAADKLLRGPAHRGRDMGLLA